MGSFDKAEVQVGAGIPFTVFGKQGGTYLFGLLEDSNTWVKDVKAQQRFIQATTSVDNAVGPFRLEFGGQMQNSITSGAYMNRVTQDMVDTVTTFAAAHEEHGPRCQRPYRLHRSGVCLAGKGQSQAASNLPLLSNLPYPTSTSTILIIPCPRPPAFRRPWLAYLNAHPELNCKDATVDERF